MGREYGFIRCSQCGRLTATDTGFCRHCKAPLVDPLYGFSGFVDPPENYRWEVFLGYGPNRDPVGLKFDDLKKHVVVVGIPGSGKTTFVKRMLYEVSRHGRNFLVLDWEGEYHDMSVLGAVVLSSPSSRSPLKLPLFNPGEMYTESYAYWLSSILTRITREEGWEFTPQMELVLKRAVVEAVELKASLDEFDEILERNALQYPQGRMTWAAIHTRIFRILRGPLSHVFVGGNTLKNPLEKRLVIDLSWISQISSRDAWFLATLVLNYTYAYALKLSPRDLSTKYIIVVEEAERIAPPSPRVGELTTLPDMMIHLRKRGVGVVVVTQSPAIVDSAALRVAGNIVVFKLLNPEDVKIMASYLGSEDLAGIIRSLKTGECLVRPSGLGEPFAVKISPPPPPDSDLARCLKSIYDYPYLNQRERRSYLGMDSRRYKRVIEALCAQKLIEIVRVYRGRGRPVKLLQPRGMIPGVAHLYLEHYATRTIERIVGVKPTKLSRGPDLVFELKGVHVCVEIETGTNMDIGKYMRMLEDICGVIIVICGSKKLLRKAERISNFIDTGDRIIPTSLAGLQLVLKKFTRKLSWE